MHNHVIHRLARCHTLMDYYSLRFQYKDQTAICCYNVVVSMTKRGGRVNGDHAGDDKSGVVRPTPATRAATTPPPNNGHGTTSGCFTAATLNFLLQ